MTTTTYESWRGQTVLGANGDKLGKIEDVYLDEVTNEPVFATVHTGLFGTKTTFVPLQGLRQQGEELVLPFSKEQVKDAPRIDRDEQLSPDEELRLYEHYGLGSSWNTQDRADLASDGRVGTTGRTERDISTTTTTGVAGTGVTGRHERGVTETAGTGVTGRHSVGHDVSGPNTDEAMTRSEEQLRVGTERVESGRARLRKYIVTENVTQTVPVRREEVRVVREPITEANRGAALDGPALSEEEHEVTLHEERPVVQKETVPVERVRLDTEEVVDEKRISEQVRKENIVTDDAYPEGDRGNKNPGRHRV